MWYSNDAVKTTQHVREGSIRNSPCLLVVYAEFWPRRWTGLKPGLSNRAMLGRRRTVSFSGAFVLFGCRADKVQSKPQASVYDILPPTTAVPGCAMQYCKLTDSLRLCPHNSKLVTNRQLKLCQAPCFLLPLTMLTPAQIKRKSLELRQRQHSSGAVWESRWPSWAVRPNEPSGFRGRKAITIEPCFGIGHSLSLICQLTSEDIKHHFSIIIVIIIINWDKTSVRFYPGTDAPRVSVRAWTPCCFHDHNTQTFRTFTDGADNVTLTGEISVNRSVELRSAPLTRSLPCCRF